MIIIDKTPYRSKTGEISPVGLIQGMLKYGMSWQNRLKAQDVAIAIIEKQLDSNFALLRNITLPNTDIYLPLVLIGPPGVYLLNVMHERGVYKARDDQWGTMIGDRFVPAKPNHLARTLTFGRVLQVYLDRQGFKGSVVVESVLMAADPGMQIESTRPAVRVVMSDALERFAASMSNARSMISAPLGKDIVKAILVGISPKVAGEYAAQETQQDDDMLSSTSFGGFAFDDSEQEPEPAAKAPQETDWLNNLSEDRQSASTPAAPIKLPKAAPRKKKGPLGLTTPQLLTLVGMGFFILCIAAVGLYFVLTLPNG